MVQCDHRKGQFFFKMRQQHALSKCFDLLHLQSDELVDLLMKEHARRNEAEEIFKQAQISARKMFLHKKTLERAINTNINEERKREIEMEDSKTSLALIRDLMEDEKMDDRSTMIEIEKILSFYYKCDRNSLAEYRNHRMKQLIEVNSEDKILLLLQSKEKPTESCQEKRKMPSDDSGVNEQQARSNKKQKTV